MERNRTGLANAAIIGIYNILLIVFIISILYIAKVILLPIITALLLTLLFSPVINYLERWLGRILSITIFVSVLFLLSGMVGYTFYKQVVYLANDLPRYSENIQEKLTALKISSKKIFSPFSFEELNETESVNNTKAKATQSDSPNNENAIPVKIINQPSNINFSYEYVFGSIITFLGYTILVMVLLSFMLYYREDLRARILHIIGKKQISSATKAIEDTSDRVSKYLLSLMVVNIFYGIVVTLGLSLIGIPNAALWGIMGGVLRFIPYVGFIVSAFFPVLLSFIITDGYIILLQTVGFFLIIELIISYLIEPILYGNQTGVSPIALIIATLFWTWLWGTMGLVLAVPLTVCLVVIGTHISRFEFLNILMGGVPKLSAHEDLYLRIMGGDLNYVMVAIDNYLKDRTIVELYDEVIIPVIVEVERDYHNQSLTAEQKEWVLQIIQDIIKELETRQDDLGEQYNIPDKDCKILCFGAHAGRDDLATLIISQLLSKVGYDVNSLLYKDAIAGLITSVEENKPLVICISIIWPSSIIDAKYICNKLQKSYPDIKIIIGFWTLEQFDQDKIQRLKNSGADYVVTTMQQAMTQIGEICKSEVVDHSEK